MTVTVDFLYDHDNSIATTIIVIYDNCEITYDRLGTEDDRDITFE